MSNSILIGCHFLAFGKFWWLLLAVDELVRGFVWPCFVCHVQIRCCVSGCCYVLVQDRYHVGVAFFYYTIRCFFGGLLWDFLFCFFAISGLLLTLVLVLPFCPHFCCSCTAFVNDPD